MGNVSSDEASLVSSEVVFWAIFVSQQHSV